MRDVHGNTHVGEMEAVAAPNQRNSDDVVAHEFLEVLARLLEHQHQHNGLLRPVARLEQVVRLDDGLVGSVREALVHADRVEVPHGRARHDPDAERAVETKVQRRVRLLHEARLLRPLFDAIANRQRAKKPLHAELAREGQHYHVEAHKGKVACSLAIVRRAMRVGAHSCWYERIARIKRVREEQARGYGVRRVRVYEVQRCNEEGEQQRAEPRVAYTRALELGEGAAHRATFGAAGGLV